MANIVAGGTSLPVALPTTTIPRAYRGFFGLGAFSWGDLLTGGVQSFQRIAEARWGQPPPGTAITTGPGGTQIIRQPNIPGAQFGISTFPGLDFGSGGTDLIKWGLIAAVIIGGISVLKK